MHHVIHYKQAVNDEWHDAQEVKYSNCSNEPLYSVISYTDEI